MSEALDRAEDLVAEITAHLVAAALDKVTVTLDLLKVPGALAVGPVVAIQPPKIEYVTHSVSDYTWELFVISGPSADRLEAWGRIAPVIEALRLPLDLDEAEPATFTHPSIKEHPAYVLTFTERIY